MRILRSYASRVSTNYGIITFMATTYSWTLTPKQLAFCLEYLKDFNGTQAAIRAGYSPKTAHVIAHENLRKPKIIKFLRMHLEYARMGANEALLLLARQARGDIGELIAPNENGDGYVLELRDEDDQPKPTTNIKKIKSKKTTTVTDKGSVIEDVETTLEMYSSQKAILAIVRAHGIFSEAEIARGLAAAEAGDFSIPAHLIAPEFFAPYRSIRRSEKTEYLMHGGRGSTKSSFISLMMIELIINNPKIHGLATRHVGNTLRDSVHAQLRWAIGELGQEDKFKTTVSPLEIEYLPTGQKIYFRGGDDPVKIKSIKTPFGYIGMLWFEELDQFRGTEAIRSIEQSAMRGGEIAFIFKSFNPPRTASNWANKYVKVPKANQYQHFSNYLTVPPEWLGRTFLEEAEHLKLVNPLAYEHEYMGVATGTGGMIFENVIIKRITDKLIATFDRNLEGLDWGYFPDPFDWGRMHLDKAKLTLYIYDEYRVRKASNRKAYNYLVKNKKIDKYKHLIIADSAEPKSIADFRKYGANIRGAEKGPDSVSYSMKWLQSLRQIVIDDRRAPFTAEEFLNYELEKDKDGEFISAYPDKDNHAIDRVRYATNLHWRRRGE